MMDNAPQVSDIQINAVARRVLAFETITREIASIKTRGPGWEPVLKMLEEAQGYFAVSSQLLADHIGSTATIPQEPQKVAAPAIVPSENPEAGISLSGLVGKKAA